MRRAPVQGEPRYRRVAGTVSWDEHEEAWREYARRFGPYQSAERIAERHGFGYSEMTDLLGREPTTWEPRT